MSHPPPLNYAPPPPLHHRPRFRRVIYVTVLLGILLAGRWWIPPAWQRAQLLYWQRQCLEYKSPSGLVVADSRSNLSISPRAWTRFYTIYSPPGLNSSGTVFLHEMKCADGDQRLVAVDITKYSTGIALHGRVFILGNGLHPPEEIIRSWNGGAAIQVKSWFQATAGQIDPADSSHFTFTLTYDGNPEIENGWLTQYDTIEFGEAHSRGR